MAEDNNILDFYPDGEEDSCAEDSYVTLVDDEGNEVEMSVVDIVEHKGENYVILLPVENIESGDMQFAVMKIEYDEDRDMLIIRQLPTQLKDQLKRRKD